AGDAGVHVPPDALAPPAGRLRGEVRLRLGLVPELLLRPARGARALQPLSRRARARGDPRLRRRLRERAPPERLRPDALAEPVRGDARAANQEDEDRRRGKRAPAL